MNAMPHSILLVDDDASMRRTLRISLKANGYAVEEAQSGEEAVEAVRARAFDLVLLDCKMPGIGGVEACRRIRAITRAAGIVMISVRDGEDDQIQALEAGADDYVTKPLRPRQLLARLRALLRRTNPAKEVEPQVLRAGKLELDVEHRTLRRAGEAVHLSPTEFSLLRFLMEHRDVPIEHSKLLRAIWGPEYGSELEYLRTYIRLLRRKIEDDPTQPEYLLTEPWLGYRFRDPTA
jgi:two-component system KDP operon response regulator KdpE